MAGVEEDPGEDDRGDRPGEHAEQQPAAAEELHPGGEDERPEEVELLLHRERPEVGEELGPPELFEVRGVGEDEVPVGEVEERGEGVAADLVDLVRVGDRRDDHRHRDQHADRGQQAAGAAQPEAAELDVAGAAELAQEQRGDQVAADRRRRRRRRGSRPAASRGPRGSRRRRAPRALASRRSPACRGSGCPWACSSSVPMHNRGRVRLPRSRNPAAQALIQAWAETGA